MRSSYAIYPNGNLSESSYNNLFAKDFCNFSHFSVLKFNYKFNFSKKLCDFSESYSDPSEFTLHVYRYNENQYNLINKISKFLAVFSNKMS